MSSQRKKANTRIKNLAIKKSLLRNKKTAIIDANTAVHIYKNEDRITDYSIDIYNTEAHSNTIHQQNEQSAQAHFPDNNTANPIKQHFTRIAVENKNNSLHLSILNSMNLPSHYINQLKHI